MSNFDTGAVSDVLNNISEMENDTACFKALQKNMVVNALPLATQWATQLNKVRAA